MGPVATALLVTLLPTCLLILGLALLSIHLHLKLRAAHVEAGLQLHTLPTTAKIPLPEQPPLEPAQPARRDPLSGFSDASNPDWENDVHFALEDFIGWPVHKDSELLFLDSTDEIRAKGILDALGYKGVPTRVVLGLLRRRSTRLLAVHHIVMSIALANTSLESKSSTSLFPFLSEVCADLRKFPSVSGDSNHSLKDPM